MRPYQTATFYFLTGTGNSFRAATWLAEAAQRRGVTTRVKSIQQADPSVEIQPGAEAWLGLVFPTHAFTTPWRMMLFVLRLPRRPGTHAVVMPTRAGMRLGNLYFPGLEGTGAYLVALLLTLKGYVVRGVLGLDMPSNWTVLHPGFGRSAAQGILDRAQARVGRFMDQLLSGRRHLGGWVELALGLALLPLSLAYLLMGRFFLSKLFFATAQCNGCGLCAQACPAQAIRMWTVGRPRGRLTARPYWTFACESCMRCMNFCPQQAIEASYPLGAAFYFVTSPPAAWLLLNWLGAQWPGLAAAHLLWAQVPLQYLYMLASIGLTYAAFALLLRVPAINRLFTLTTPTHYYRRYHEPASSLKDIR
jgi:Pyruvate/2-oxoacid:ferredoxin oxidoreductase delta subunit